jgi:VIT1/CCC1 family predicted Fe2+/Mn2+ transporter
MPRDARLRRYRANWQSEIDSAFLYEAMARAEQDESIARVYRQLGATEAKHATFWSNHLRQLGVEAGLATPSWRARILAWSATRLGPRSVLGLVASSEHAGRNVYVGQPETTATKMTAEEHTHALVLQSMLEARKGAKGSELASIESRHHRIGGNALRAAVLGANDGLCSNLSLVMGVAGASASNHTILVGGMAGLLAGACSMALGEWVSVTSSRELAERELRIERDELAVAPEEEREELQLIYEAKGLPAQEASELSRKLVGDEKAAMQVLAREELGIDPQQLGNSARVAATSSFFLFAVGALVPVLPFVFLSGRAALLTSLGVSSLALFGFGAAITIFTGRPILISGGRQLLLGLAAAGITFGVGTAFR